MSLNNARHVVLGSLVTTPPAPVLPEKTIRCKFISGYTPSRGDTQTLVDAQDNVWDIYKASNDWSRLLSGIESLLEVVDANTTGITNMSGMFSNCASITSVPLFDTATVTDMSSMLAYCDSLLFVPALSTASVTNMSDMCRSCTRVQSGALALYQQASTQANPPTSYDSCFYRCGIDTASGAAELAQIPASWGGTGA